MKEVFYGFDLIRGERAEEALNYIAEEDEFLMHLPGFSSEEYIEAYVRTLMEAKEKFGVKIN